MMQCKLAAILNDDSVGHSMAAWNMPADLKAHGSKSFDSRAAMRGRNVINMLNADGQN